MHKQLYIVLLTLAALLPGVTTGAQEAKNPVYLSYIEKWKATALAQEKQYGIPAAITLAQGLLESGAGQSDLATQANNHFGIKCHSEWEGDTFRKDDDKRDECFRSYYKAEDSFRDHSLFLKKKRYEVLFTYDIKDYAKWANGLKACGYATDPKYPQKLIRIIETYGLNDLKPQKTAPQAPLKEERPQPEVAQREKPDQQSAVSEPQKPKKPEQPQKPNKPTKPTKPGKTHKPVQQHAEQVQLVQTTIETPTTVYEHVTDTVVWRPAQFRANPLYQNHGYGKTNGQKFIVAQEGDTWGSIAYMLAMEEKTLRRINDATDKQPLRGGDRIYLFPKHSKAEKSTPRHLVQPGETAWDIAQKYGIRLSSLYKLNGIPEGTPLKTQQWLDLR